MLFPALVRTGLIASALVLAACGPSAETERAVPSFGDPAPRARDGQAIILGKDEVIRISDLAPAEYRRHLVRNARSFARDTADTVYFASGADRLDAGARAVLDAQAAWILAHRQVRVSVTGHADDFRDPESNLRLGMERARAVVTYLVAMGVPPERLIALASEGDTAPLAVLAGASRLNRRVETEVVELIEVADGDRTADTAPGGPGSGPGTSPGGGTGGGPDGGHGDPKDHRG